MRHITRRQWLNRAACVAAASLASRAGAEPSGAAAGPSVLVPPAFDPRDLAQARALIERAGSDGQVWRLAKELAVGIGPRPAGSAGDRRAVEWAQQAMRQLGLSRVRAQAMPLKVWVRGSGSARLLGQAPRDLVMAALGNSVSTPPQGLQAEVAWYPTLAALMDEPPDPARSRAAGRIVFVDQRTERTRDGSGYGRAVGARLNGPIEAARRGAIAYGLRSVGTSGGAAPDGAPTDARRDAQRIAHTGATRYDLRVPAIPAFAVSVPDADVIAERAARGLPLQLRLRMDNRLDVPAETHNVIGEVPGTDLAHEVVLISAHLDSWDLGQGAVDDGAGVAIVTAAAALMARDHPAPRRTIRVVLFGNEENGFDGARAYAQAHAAEPHQLVAESDFGGGRIHALSSRVRPEAWPLFDQMAALLKPLGVEPGGREANPGPDAALLMRTLRWPALQLHQDGTRYFDVHHTERDTIDQLDEADLRQNTACWAAAAWLSAQAPVSFAPLRAPAAPVR